MKSDHSLLRPFLILDCLRKNTSENNPVETADLKADIEEIYGVTIDRHTIGKIFDELNIALYAAENGTTIEQAAEWLEQSEPGERYIIKSRSGNYLQQHMGGYTASDVRLIAECIYSARFISEKQTENLVDTVCGLISDGEARSIRHKAPALVETRKTINQEVFHNLEVLNHAMERTRAHRPRKVSFIYTSSNKENLAQQAARRGGKRYVVNPYHLLVNDGNYYLLCYDENAKNGNLIRSYRVDRMKSIREEEEEVAGQHEMVGFDFTEYARTLFGMFDGPEERVNIRFINPLLDTMVERFGRKNSVNYSTVDDKHMEVTAKIRISDQFFGWVLGFGRKVKIIGPDNVVKQFKEYLEKVKSIYE